MNDKKNWIVSVNHESNVDVKRKQGISRKEPTLKAIKTSQERQNSISIPKYQNTTEMANKSDSNSISNGIKPENLIAGKCKSLGIAIIDYDISRFSNIYNKYELLKFIYELLELIFQ